VTPKYRQKVTIIHLAFTWCELENSISKRPYPSANLGLSLWHAFRSFVCKLKNSKRANAKDACEVFLDFLNNFRNYPCSCEARESSASTVNLKSIKDTTMVRSTIRMLIPTEKQGEALEILRSTIDQAQFEPGCVSCWVYRGVEDARAIMIEELWTSEEDMQQHLQSDKYRNVLLVVEMAVEPPEIRFDVIAHSDGVERIEQARVQIH
jgi:quinol monooxygenase YgiN